MATAPVFRVLGLPYLKDSPPTVLALQAQLYLGGNRRQTLKTLTLNPKPYTLHPKPETPNRSPKP